VQKSELLRELQKEIRRHDLSTFVDDPPSAAQAAKASPCPVALAVGSDSAQSRSFWTI
jgi:hypothetical protein